MYEYVPVLLPLHVLYAIVVLGMITPPTRSKFNSIQFMVHVWFTCINLKSAIVFRLVVSDTQSFD